MATFASKFGIGDLVHLSLQASYYQNPAIYKVDKVEFSSSEISYSIKLTDKPNSGSLLVAEEDLSFSQE